MSLCTAKFLCPLYRLQVLIQPSLLFLPGKCASTGCMTDLNRQCPAELRAAAGAACKSACEAFGSPEYCCSGMYSSPSACKPTLYSQIFKTACPKSYSYAYDDATSTFTCSGADYTITFCPNSPRYIIVSHQFFGSLDDFIV